MTKTWKAVEGRIAKIFHSTRTPLSGSNSKHTMSDTLHKELYIEIKHGEAMMIECLDKAMAKDTLVMITDGNKRKLIMVHIDNMIKRPVKYTKQIQRKNFAIFGLFIDTMRKAKEENKVPLVCLHRTGKYGFLVICRVSNYQQIRGVLNEE